LGRSQVSRGDRSMTDLGYGLVGRIVALHALSRPKRSGRRRSRAPKDFLTYQPPKPRSSRPRKPVGQREAVAYQVLYRLGYSINQIARAFGRSPSVVWRRIAKYVRWGLLRRRGYGPQDLRKLPASTRRLSARRRWRELLRWLPLWLAFIEGEVDEPP